MSKQRSSLKVFKSILGWDLIRKFFSFIASRNCINVGINFPDRDGKINVPVRGSIHILISAGADRFLFRKFSKFT